MAAGDQSLARRGAIVSRLGLLKSFSSFSRPYLISLRLYPASSPVLLRRPPSSTLLLPRSPRSLLAPFLYLLTLALTGCHTTLPDLLTLLIRPTCALRPTIQYDLYYGCWEILPNFWERFRRETLPTLFSSADSPADAIFYLALPSQTLGAACYPEKNITTKSATPPATLCRTLPNQ